MKNEAIEIIIENLRGNYSKSELLTIRRFLKSLQEEDLDIPGTWKIFAKMLHDELPKLL